MNSLRNVDRHAGGVAEQPSLKRAGKLREPAVRQATNFRNGFLAASRKWLG